MPDHVAFLKGMNLGRRRITNDELRAAIESLGLDDVSTFRASGNVLFTSPRRLPEGKLGELIEAGLHDRLGYEVPTFLRSREELRAIAARSPFSAEQTERLGGKHQVMLLGAAPSASARRAALALAGPEDALVIDGRELHWLPAGGVTESSLDLAALARQLGANTTRTMGTIEQIAARCDGR